MQETSQYSRCSIRRQIQVPSCASRSMQLRIFADLPYVWFTIRLTIRDEHVSPHHRSLIVNLTMHLKLNSARPHLAICLTRIPYRSDSVSGQSRCNVLLFGRPSCCCYHVESSVPSSSSAEYFCESRIANFTFVLDTRVACVPFDIFYLDLLVTCSLWYET